MNRITKVVLILATILLIVIVWMGPKFKMAVLPKVKPSVPKDKAAELDANELKKIDEMLRKIEERKRSATVEEAEGLNELRKILEAAKGKGRLPLPGEPSSIAAQPAVSEGVLLPPLPEEDLEAGQPGFPEMPLPEDLPEEFQR